MGFLFQKNDCKKIYLAKDAKESVLLAMQDFIRDVRAVCGDVIVVSESDFADIIIFDNKHTN